ncbi:hypothetical protein ACQYRI_06090 [Salmonella enterica]
METITLKVNGKPNISFTGKLLASNVYQYGEDVVYETAKGNWFVARLDNEDFMWDSKLIENKSKEDLFEFLGFSEDAKSIYAQMGIEHVTSLDI